MEWLNISQRKVLESVKLMRSRREEDKREKQKIMCLVSEV